MYDQNGNYIDPLNFTQVSNAVTSSDSWNGPFGLKNGTQWLVIVILAYLLVKK